MHKYWLTGFIDAKIPTSDGILQIDATSPLFEEYTAFIAKQKLADLNDFQVRVCHHFVYMKNGIMIAGLSVLFAAINFMPTSMCASIEIVVSKVKGSGAVMVEMIRDRLARRKATCFMVTQAAESRSASEFWLKKACACREAKCLAFMIMALNPEYKLHEDVTYMMLKL